MSNNERKQIVEKLMEFKALMNDPDLVHNFDIKYILEPEMDVAKAIEEMVDVSSKMMKVFLYSPESIYIADKEGKTLSVNKAFEQTVGIDAKSVVGKNVSDLEAQGVFRPSVLRLTKEENHPVSLLQTGFQGENIIVTGVPIFDGNGELNLLVSNARRTEEIEGLYSYVYEKKNSSRKQGEPFSDPSEEMVLQSEPMKQIRFLIEQIKNTDATVLITGESGVGKGVIARRLHKTSNRAEKIMIEINCGALPENLIESELFGYTAGAFTGASAGGKKGLIEAADEGTLFLDEIGEIPLPMQVKLLKVLQDKQITRIGGTTPNKVDIRIIAATNQNLEELVQQGKFRADLYYRLNVIPIKIPPLRERKEDIETAVEYFSKKFSKKYNRSILCTKEFTKDAISHDWPGNIRELENHIERAVLMCNDGVLSAIPQQASDHVKFSEVFKSEKNQREWEKYENNPEAQIIRDLYEKYRSSYKVAEELGYSQSKAYRLIKKYCR